MEKTIKDFEATYDKYLAAIADGREPSPATLYNLDRYWQMQAQLKEELQKLGDKEILLMSEKFEQTWLDVYNSVAIKSEPFFALTDTSVAKEMVNSVWCADGKSWSQRVWGNTEKLAQTLNDELISCVVAGRKTTDLKKALQERFGVSYRQAETLARTEIAQIEVSAAGKRYKDYGLKYYQFLGREEHDIGCDCKRLNGKKFKLSEMKIGVNAPPLHPRCRCDIIPVVDDDLELISTKGMKQCKYCGVLIKSGNYCDDCKNEAFNYDYRANDGRYKSPNWFMKHGATTEDILDTHFKQGWYLPSQDKAYKSYVANLEKEMEKAKGVNKYQYYKLKKELDEIYDGNMRWYSNEFTSKAYDAKKTGFMSNNFQFCIECGKPYKVEGKNNRSNRCPECYAEYRKRYKAQKERERRAKKKKK